MLNDFGMFVEEIAKQVDGRCQVAQPEEKKVVVYFEHTPIAWIDGDSDNPARGVISGVTVLAAAYDEDSVVDEIEKCVRRGVRWVK